MEKIKMSDESLESFIKEFLPEGKLLHNPDLELVAISNVVLNLFQVEDYNVFIGRLFRIFFKLHYPISVIEPLRNSEKYQPYIDTNSNSIYIAVDHARAKELKKLSEILKSNTPTVTPRLKKVYHSLNLFANSFSR